MKNKSQLLLAIITIFFIVFVFALPASATIPDGTYKLQYEMKEAGSENTSIADGYFTKPATLTVKDGVQYIQMTVTGSNYIQSLSAPSGPVEIVSEDTANHVRTVKFRVDGDLSKPLNMEMHIIVPDLYDMTHTARAVFDVSALNKGQAASEKNATQDNSKQQSTNKETKTETVEKDKQVKEESKKETAESAESSAKEKAPDEKVVEKEEEVVEEDKEELEETDEQEESETAEDVDLSNTEEASDTEEAAGADESSVTIFWVVLIIFIIVSIGFIWWMLRNKRSK